MTRSLWIALIAVTAIWTVVAVGAVVWLNAETVSRDVEACELRKEDRVDNARAHTAYERYFKLVNETPGVPEPVRKAAVEAKTKGGESANQLRTRILDCDRQYRDGEQVIDERLLREALGDL